MSVALENGSMGFHLFGGDKLREAVEALLKSDISAYKISKESGLPYMIVNDLLTGDSQLDETDFSTVEKLFEFAEIIKDNNEEVVAQAVEDSVQEKIYESNEKELKDAN